MSRNLAARPRLNRRSFWHIIPDKDKDLPPQFQEYGFENRDFHWRGTKLYGRCVDAVPLPDYPIARIHTGQYLPGQGELGREEIALAAPAP